jgi:hypothetical protein
MPVLEAGTVTPDERDGTVMYAHGRGAISADDPDVGVVYDDDDEEIEVGPDGKVKRRHRRAILLVRWAKSELARKLFRYAWVPLFVVMFVAGAEGFLFSRSWRAARTEGRQRDAELSAARARLEAAKPKLTHGPQVPAGYLVLKVKPPGSVVWIDGIESGAAPSTMLTKPGAHRLVITAPGYRMLRDVVDTTHGAVIEHDLAPAEFPFTGAVGVNVSCVSEAKYPVFVDGREIGALCPVAGVRLDPGHHTLGVFVIPQNREWTVDRQIVAERPGRVQFNY